MTLQSGRIVSNAYNIEDPSIKSPRNPFDMTSRGSHLGSEDQYEEMPLCAWAAPSGVHLHPYRHRSMCNTSTIGSGSGCAEATCPELSKTYLRTRNNQSRS